MKSNDRFYSDGRIRNGYQAGELVQPAGWEPNGKKGTVRIPVLVGPDGSWFEDPFIIGSNTRSTAWCMLALVAYVESVGSSAYLSTATKMGDWIENNLRDTRGSGGYLAGYVGAEPAPTRSTTKSTEDNAILSAAFPSTSREPWSIHP